MEETAGITARATISESNRSQIMHHLYQHGVSSRATIAKSLNLTPAAITKITARLIEAGVIEETGGIEGRKNRRSIGLKLDTAKYHVIGVKFARSIVQIGVFDLAGAPINVETLPEVTNDAVDETVARVHTALNDLIASDPAIIAVGMAVPGPYLRHIGRIAVVSSMGEWRKVNFLREFRPSVPVPLFVEQDARAGALAQYLFSPDVSTEDLAYYLLGEGVGLGVIDHGRLVNGSLGAATEIGHISIDIDGRPCECGNVGCLERYCSTPAIHEMIDEAGIVDDSRQLTHNQACRRLFAMASEGDKDAVSIVRRIGRYVGFGAVTIFNAYNPERIVIGDIVAEAGPLLLREVQSVVDRHAIPELNDTTTITLSKLPADAALNGAAAVAITQFLEHPSLFFDLT